MFTKFFWVSAVERMLKTAAQSLLVLWPVSDAALGLLDVDWKKALSVAGMMALTSLLMSLVSSGFGPDGSPSLVGEPPKEPEALLEDDSVRTVEAKYDLGDDEDEPHRHAADGEDTDIPASTFTTPPSATRYDGSGTRIEGKFITPERDEHGL